MLNIGSTRLKSPWIMAPMAGFTDAATRTICEEMGAAMTYTEMVSAKGLYYGGSKTGSLTYIPDSAGPTALQIFGSEPEIMAYAAKELDGLSNATLDINMGCPMPKVVKNGDGSALMKNPDLVYEIVKAVSEASSKPVSVKIRKGFDESTPNAVEVAKAAEEGGASAVAVHGRYRTQYYGGSTDRGIIKDVKDALSIPVIASGDVASAEDAMSMMEETGCDMVMIGRGALGNPWLFRELNAAYKGEPLPDPPTDEEKVALMLRHLELMAELKGENVAVREFRKFIPRYTKGMRNAASIRRGSSSIVEISKMRELLEESLNSTDK